MARLRGYTRPVLLSILGLALLMVVHEGGHMLVARAFGMRVIRFSIGFGPPVVRYQPKGSPTIYQVGLIPFLAYVQIAGMNPFEENDPDDTGSYANASVVARICTIFAGPAANYLAASVILFAAFMMGVGVPGTEVKVEQESAAAAAGMQDGDKIVKVADKPVEDFSQLRDAIIGRGGQATPVTVQRGDEQVQLRVTPKLHVDEQTGKQVGVLGVRATGDPVRYESIPVSRAAQEAVVRPAIQVQMSVVGLSRLITGQEPPKLTGPIGIVKATSKAAEVGFQRFLLLLAGISTALAFFNMLPFPALDGGRLVFLGYEAVTRRRPDQRMETNVHIVGLLLLLSLIFVVSYTELFQ